jgi:hypothetical protein
MPTKQATPTRAAPQKLAKQHPIHGTHRNWSPSPPKTSENQRKYDEHTEQQTDRYHMEGPFHGSGNAENNRQDEMAKNRKEKKNRKKHNDG